MTSLLYAKHCPRSLEWCVKVCTEAWAYEASSKWTQGFVKLVSDNAGLLRLHAEPLPGENGEGGQTRTWGCDGGPGQWYDAPVYPGMFEVSRD